MNFLPWSVIAPKSINRQLYLEQAVSFLVTTDNPKERRTQITATVSQESLSIRNE